MKNRLLLVAVVMCVGYGAGHAYIPVMLHSELVPHTQSLAVGIGDGQQVGHSNPTGVLQRALLWNGTAGSVIDLTPTGYSHSNANAAHGGKQYGHALHPGLNQVHPIIWNGSASSYENLFVANLGGHNFQNNHMYGAAGNQQVGAGTPYAGPKNNFDPGPRAMMWSGTSASAQLLHPDHLNVVWSIAYATDGVQQVGWGIGSGAAGTPGNTAILWHGTGQSAIDLTPAGATRSIALGVSGGQQVGAVDFQPALWFGSKGSYVNLAPDGHLGTARGTNSVHQVGHYRGSLTEGVSHAARWSGSAGSLLDLHELLPPAWGAMSSTAWAIDAQGNIVGQISDSQGWKAVMWVVPEPGTMAALGAGVALLAMTRRRKRQR